MKNPDATNGSRTPEPLTILTGDCREMLRTLEPESVQCCVTSPPYWGLRSYGGGKAEIGKEITMAQYISNVVEVFREVKRVLKDDGTLWLNLGDSYSGSRKARGGGGKGPMSAKQRTNAGAYFDGPEQLTGLKPKDLCLIPFRVALALQEDGWWVRSEIIWHKPNPMPESVTDRPTCAHEKIFLLAKSQKYFYDHEAIKEAPSPALVKQVEEGYNGNAVKDYLAVSVQDASKTKRRIIDNARKRIDKQRGHGNRHNGFNDRWDKLTVAEQQMLGANKRNVWTVATANYSESHFATFPTELIKPCILAGSRAGDVVLDPFFGSGTTGMVALELGRSCVGIELNPEYAEMARQRCNVTPGLPLNHA